MPKLKKDNGGRITVKVAADLLKDPAVFTFLADLHPMARRSRILKIISDYLVTTSDKSALPENQLVQLSHFLLKPRPPIGPPTTSTRHPSMVATKASSEPRQRSEPTETLTGMESINTSTLPSSIAYGEWKTEIPLVVTKPSSRLADRWATNDDE